jgi:ATP adenylyltransferase/5',5'''-P-1,P-4-tetraphosphate phosphorylase II
MRKWALLVAVLSVWCAIQDLVFYNNHPEDGRCRSKHVGRIK